MTGLDLTTPRLQVVPRTLSYYMALDLDLLRLNLRHLNVKNNYNKTFIYVLVGISLPYLHKNT